MPIIIPIIAAATAYSGTAALIGGAFTVANVAAGITMLGSVLSVVGTVTKNEKLSKIGNGLMLVGGATSLINNLAGGAGAGVPAPTESAAATGAPAGEAVAQAGQIQTPSVLDTVASPGADLLTSPAAPLQGQGALLDASNPGTQATNSVAAAPTATAVAPIGNVTTAPAPGTISAAPGLAPKPGIIASFLKDNAAGVTVLGQGIMGAYQAKKDDDIAKRKIEEEQRVRAEEERLRQNFNTSVSGVQIQAKPWDNPLDQTQNQPGNRSLIGMVRNPA